MTNKYNTEIATNASGASSYIGLEPGLWNIFVTSNSWGSGTLQASADNVNWMNVLNNDGGQVTFTQNSVEEINGGILLRLNMGTTPSGTVSLIAKKTL